MNRLALAGSLAALSLVATAPSAGAAVTVGQLPAGQPLSPNCASPVDRLQPLVVSGTSYVSPTNGTITSWSTLAGPEAGGQIKLKVFRPISGLTYQAVAQDVPRLLVPSTLNTFQTTNIQIQRGDLVGLNSFAGIQRCGFVVTGDSYFRHPAAPATGGDLANGQSATFTFTGEVANRRLNIQAVIEPTNTLTFGKARFNKKKGFAILPVNVPNDGELTFGGKKVKVASSGATVARTIRQADTINVRINAKGKKRRKLLSAGKVKVKPLFNFTPTGGTLSRQARKLKLKKN